MGVGQREVKAGGQGRTGLLCSNARAQGGMQAVVPLGTEPVLGESGGHPPPPLCK